MSLFYSSIMNIYTFLFAGAGIFAGMAPKYFFVANQEIFQGRSGIDKFCKNKIRGTQDVDKII